MCELNKELNKDKVTGYKVVAKRNGEYYSLALGFKYKQPTHTFGKRTKQKRITQYFVGDLLRFGFKECLVGRTAAFTRLQDARLLKRRVKLNQKDEGTKENIVVVKVKLTERLMKGNYRVSKGAFVRVWCPVVAGHTMEILREVH